MKIQIFRYILRNSCLKTVFFIRFMLRLFGECILLCYRFILIKSKWRTGRLREVMFNQSTLFLIILLLLGYFGKNQSIIISVYILLGIQLFKFDTKLFPLIQERGMSIGVTIITLSVLIPIATGEIGFTELLESVRNYYGWIALGAGLFVSIVARGGLDLLANDPHLTTALVMGTILAVVFLQGVAVGPLIGAGIAYMVMNIVDYFMKLL